MRIAYKIWLDNDGEAFGEGPRRLLVLVEQTGSLSAAAAAMGMSYSKAWRIIKQMETRLGFPLIERRTGGAEGGGSTLTAEARDLICRYNALLEEAHRVLDRLYARYFENDVR